MVINNTHQGILATLADHSRHRHAMPATAMAGLLVAEAVGWADLPPRQPAHCRVQLAVISSTHMLVLLLTSRYMCPHATVHTA